MGTDWVFWGSILSVVVSLLVLVYLGFKLKKLMDTTHSED